MLNINKYTNNKLVLNQIYNNNIKLSILHIKKYILQLINNNIYVNKNQNKNIKLFYVLFLHIINIFKNNLKITDIEIIKVSFFNLFFERVIFYKNNDYIPNYLISFEFIHYFGYENEYNSIIQHIIKNYKIIKNPFYVNIHHKNFKFIFKYVSDIIDHNDIFGGNKHILQNNIRRIDILHNFNTSNINNNIRKIIKNIAKNNILSNSTILHLLTFKTPIWKS